MFSESLCGCMFAWLCVRYASKMIAMHECHLILTCKLWISYMSNPYLIHTNSLLHTMCPHKINAISQFSRKFRSAPSMQTHTLLYIRVHCLNFIKKSDYMYRRLKFNMHTSRGSIEEEKVHKTRAHNVNILCAYNLHE